MWIDLQYSFGAAFSEKEREIIDALELPRRFGRLIGREGG